MRHGRTETRLVGDILGVSELDLRVSSDGTMVGFLAVGPKLIVFDTDTGKYRATVMASHPPEVGTIDADFASDSLSIQWAFGQANCELQDIDSGKMKCGTCDNRAYVGRRADKLEIKKNCIK